MKKSYMTIFLFAVFARAWSAESVDRLPAYSVAPEFTLLLSVRWRDGDNTVKFISVDDRSELSRYNTFRSVTLKSGDEIVSIDGKPVAQMMSHECRVTMSRAAPGKKIELEVREPGSRAVRKVTAFRVVRAKDSGAEEEKSAAK